MIMSLVIGQAPEAHDVTRCAALRVYGENNHLKEGHMLKKILAVAALAAAGGISGVSLALTGASAATTTVTATTSVSGHPDTTSPTPPAGTACTPSPGGPVWAKDAYTSTLTAVPSGTSGTWNVTIQDNGSFAAFADPATCKAMLSSGSFLFLYTVKVTSAGTPSQANLHSSYTTQSTAQMVRDFFGDQAATVAGGDYFASYQDGRYVQTTTSIYGDVVASPAPVLTLAYCGEHVWKVTQNKSLVATKFRYFSKVGTSILLDGSATVASGGSVKVSERPRATGGLIVRYPSAGHTVTVTGSRTLTRC
jgi:hypothetical protein